MLMNPDQAFSDGSEDVYDDPMYDSSYKDP